MNDQVPEPEALPSLVPSWGWFVIAFALVILMVLHASPVPLSPRELTYWAWGQNFALNYDGHGPLLPWLIGLSTFVLGDTEFAVRIWGPLLAAVGTAFTTATAARLFNRSDAARIAPFTVLMPVISLGSLEASLAPLSFFCAAIFAWAITGYLANPRFRYMAAAGMATGFGVLTHPGLVLLIPGLAAAWLWTPALRHLMRLESWGVLLAAALLVSAPYLLGGVIAWTDPLPAQSGLLSEWGMWLFVPFFSLIWLIFLYKFWRYTDGINLMILLMIPVSFLSFIGNELLAAAIGPTYVALVGYRRFWPAGSQAAHYISAVGHGVITLIALFLMWYPHWDQPISTHLKKGSAFLTSHYEPRALARLANAEWENQAFSGVATNKPFLVAPILFYGPATAPVFWLDPEQPNATPHQTEPLPFVADKPVLIITDDLGALSNPRLTNITILSRTKDKAETVWITASAYLKVVVD